MKTAAFSGWLRSLLAPCRLSFLILMVGLSGLCAQASRPAQSSHRPRPTASAWPAPGRRRVLRRGWQIRSSVAITAPDARVSSPGYHPRGWFAAEVPGTVVANLVRDHIYPNPNYGMNFRAFPGETYPIGGNFANIHMPPDSPYRAAWWYRKNFRLLRAPHGRQLWLHFSGINFRAAVWLNGRRIATSSRIAGTWRTYRFNITRFVRPGINTLAVKVHAPTPSDLSLSFVDWNPLAPDKDMGLFRQVYITSSGPVALAYPQVTTALDLPSFAAAHLTLAAHLLNPGAQPVTGTLVARIGRLRVSRQVTVEPGGNLRVVLRPGRYAALNLAHPRVWWPYLEGPRNLYHLRLAFLVHGRVSDRRSVTFGIRSITSRVNAARHRIFYVNGHRFLIRGAGWAANMLLRVNHRNEREQLEYVRNMHLNAVRLEGKPMDQYFYRECDRLGILVLQGWVCCSHWQFYKTWKPADFTVAGDSARDQIRRLRNHPSLAAFLYGSDVAPTGKVEDVYLRALHRHHWPNPYIAGAGSQKTQIGWTGVKMSGPYQYVAPSYWELDHHNGGAFGFITETSPGPAIPLAASLRQFLPRADWWPIDQAWDYHAGGGQFKNLNYYVQTMTRRYGAPRGLRDFERKAQATDYAGERAMFEAYGRNKFTSTGLIQWMLSNGWPSMIWNLYDFYLRPGGGYFGAKIACQPLHIQYSYDDGSIWVVNSLLKNFAGDRASVSVYDWNLHRVFHQQVIASLPANRSVRVLQIHALPGLSTTYFVRLRLTSPRGRVISRNFYWLSTQPDVFNWKKSTWYYTPLTGFANLKALQHLPPVKLTARATGRQRHGLEVDRITLRNPSKNLAFQVHLTVLRGRRGPDIHPLLWQDNFIELMPGAQRTLRVRYAAARLRGARPVIRVGGWNIQREYIPVR